MASFHPSEELLLSYSAGTCSAAMQLIISAHLSLCDTCAESISYCDTLSGAALEIANPVPVSGSCFAAIFSRCSSKRAARFEPPAEKSLPSPLQQFLAQKPLHWEDLGKNVRRAMLFKEKDGSSSALLSIRRGTTLPEHTHRGEEYVLLLEGSMIDQRGTARRGDFVYTDTKTAHAPRAGDDEDCLCLVVSAGGLRFSKRYMRVLSSLGFVS